MKRHVPCKFFLKDGFCVKGDYCDFLHKKGEILPCKNYLSPAGCRYGSSCLFLHSANTAKEKHSIKSKTIAESVQNLNQQYLQVLEESKSNESTINVPNVTLSKIWGNIDDEDDVIYFYGSALLNPVTNNSIIRKYADVVGESPVDEAVQLHNGGSGLCVFFSSGYCKFGNSCRNKHLPSTATNSKVDDSSPITAYRECGICMGCPEDFRYGILSDCDCVFCLKCIREWRKQGREISKSDLVRYLPLIFVSVYNNFTNLDYVRSAEKNLISLYLPRHCPHL